MPIGAVLGIHNTTQPAATTAEIMPSGQGDLSAFSTIPSDVQGIVATGDPAPAKARIAVLETAWEEARSDAFSAQVLALLPASN